MGGKYKRWKRFLFCTDLHGDMQDRSAVETVLAFKRIWKPEVTIFGGDLFDFRPIRKKASDEERGDSMLDDYAMGIRFLLDLKPNYYIRGNHCERMWYWRKHGSGVVRDLAHKIITDVEKECRKIHCPMLPYTVHRNMLRIGKLKMMHGFWCGENAPKQAVQWAAGACLYGHTHTIQLYSEATFEGPKVGRGVGCLCRLDMEYEAARPKSMRSAHGFVYGYIDNMTGRYKAYQAEKLGGTWLLPTEFAEFR